jgi:hypothetical protein
MKKKYDEVVNVRLPSELLEHIKELGAKYERSDNGQIVYMLRTWEENGAFNERLAKVENFIYGQQDRKRVSGE